MALTRKYEIMQINLRFSPGDVANQFHCGGQIIITVNDDVTPFMATVNYDNPDYTWAQLSAPIQATLITLRDQIIAALKTKYNSTAVTIWGQP